MFLPILIASLIGSIFALVGGVLLLVKENIARKISLHLLSLAIGSLMGAAFFELIPEESEMIGNKSVYIPIIMGILVLFLFEKTIKWYHCHDREKCETHTFSNAVLFGDAVHNFIDGIIIASSFSLGAPAGIATTIAVFFHEVPQEIGDFGVLLHAGYKKSKIFLYNFLTALATPLGAILAFFILPTASNIIPYLSAFAAGIFIYISISDLIPELRHKVKPKEFSHFFLIILSLTIMWMITNFIHE